MDDVGLLVISGRVIACDPSKLVLGNQLGEDHVKMNILYCPNNILMVVTIWKWMLAQTIMDGYSWNFFLYLMMKTTFQLPMRREKLV